MYEKYTLCGLVLGFAFAVTYTSSPNAFPFADLWGVVALGLAVNAFALLGVRLLRCRSTTVENGLLAAVVLGGVVTSHVLTPAHTRTRVCHCSWCCCAASIFWLSFFFKRPNEQDPSAPR